MVLRPEENMPAVCAERRFNDDESFRRDVGKILFGNLFSRFRIEDCEDRVVVNGRFFLRHSFRKVR